MSDKETSVEKPDNINYSFERKKNRILVYGLLILGFLVVLYPLYFMLINSFKTGTEILHEPFSFPKSWSFDSYIAVFKKFNVVLYFMNSVFISGMVTILNVLFSSMVAYGISKIRVPGRKFLFNMVIGSMMIPGILLLVPTYYMLYQWGWINTYRVLIIPGAISAYNIFLMIQFIGQIDDSYVEAARVDGANEMQIFFKIILPMAGPGIAVIAITTFLGSWNDLFGPLLYLRDSSRFTLQRAVFELNYGLPGEFRNQLYAALTMVTFPAVFVFFFLQKYIIRAYSGGVKF